MMFKLTFFRASEVSQSQRPMLRIFATPSEETATIVAGALMKKGYCVRLWGKRDQLIF